VAYKVIFAPAAIARLQDIVRYIAADDPGTAETFALHLINRAELLADFPELGTPYRKRNKVRRLRCDPYFVYYRLDRRGVLLKSWSSGTWRALSRSSKPIRFLSRLLPIGERRRLACPFRRLAETILLGRARPACRAVALAEAGRADE
jgi:plasmid stabilization system protein ParE